VLVYYGVINVAALRLYERGPRRWIAGLGVLLCLLLALLLPLAQVLITAAALAVGWTAATFLPYRR
jgi:APA family basic amino acid/polyamine antiporter